MNAVGQDDAEDQQDQKPKDRQFAALDSIIDDYQVKESKGYITKEFQDYGYRLAQKLNDLEHKGLYIKMAKEVDRGILEQALTFVSDADHAKSKAKLFMWKVQQLKEEQAKKDPEEEQQSLF